ncbi:MAG: hypothetical protein WC846_03390 [Candidatus Gracilibacteria bacterium]|jgi:hypothetical protein
MSRYRETILPETWEEIAQVLMPKPDFVKRWNEQYTTSDPTYKLTLAGMGVGVVVCKARIVGAAEQRVARLVTSVAWRFSTPPDDFPKNKFFICEGDNLMDGQLKRGSMGKARIGRTRVLARNAVRLALEPHKEDAGPKEDTDLRTLFVEDMLWTIAGETQMPIGLPDRILNGGIGSPALGHVIFRDLHVTTNDTDVTKIINASGAIFFYRLSGGDTSQGLWAQLPDGRVLQVEPQTKKRRGLELPKNIRLASTPSGGIEPYPSGILFRYIGRSEPMLVVPEKNFQNFSPDAMRGAWEAQEHCVARVKDGDKRYTR